MVPYHLQPTPSLVHTVSYTDKDGRKVRMRVGTMNARMILDNAHRAKYKDLTIRPPVSAGESQWANRERQNAKEVNAKATERAARL